MWDKDNQKRLKDDKSMNRRQFAVLGLGKFGRSVARTLSNAGYEVIAVDTDEEKVNEIADEVTYALKADVTEPEVLENIGIKNVDAVVVAMALDLGTSVMATIRAKEAGAKYVLAKASDTMHGNILKKVGADEVIFPEKAMGAKIAKKLISNNFLDLYELSKTFSIVELKMPQQWAGKTLVELNLRKKGINVIGLMEGEKVTINIEPNLALPSGATLIIAASNEILSKIV